MNGLDGATRILLERWRQQKEKGYTPEHDASYDKGELVYAAQAYAIETIDIDGIFSWPWSSETWKPSTDPIHNLERAGALLAAEIDRRLALPDDD